jgi:CHAD domain-containing protein
VADSSTKEPIRARHPELSRDATVAESFSALAEAALDHLERNAGAFKSAPEPHAVHQMRVAARRLRALLGAFRTVLPKAPRKRTAADLKRLQSVLGPARDMDVFLDDVLAGISVASVRTVLARAARNPHRSAYARVRKTAASSLLNRLRSDFERLAKMLSVKHDGGRSCRSFGRKLLIRRHRALVQRLAGAEKRSDKKLHALRIRIKKLRYEVEFFRPLLPNGGVVAYHAALAESQDVLGAFNDAVNARALARTLASSASEIDAAALEMIDAVFAAAEERARPLAQRKFAIQRKALTTLPKRWLK